jgi:hypothetical protein
MREDVAILLIITFLVLIILSPVILWGVGILCAKTALVLQAILLAFAERLGVS